MSGLDHLTRLIGHWFEFIAAQSLYAAVIALLVWATLKLWRPKHPVWIVALWSLVLIRFVLPVNFAAPWTARALVERSSATWVMQDYPKIQATQRALLPTEKSSVVTAHASTQPVRATVIETPQTNMDWKLILFLLWLAGAGALLVRLFQAYRALKSVLLRATPLYLEPLPKAVASWRATLGVRRPVTLLSSADCHGAFTCGVLRPVIVLPDALVARMDAADVSAIIGHEMAHIRGLDSLWLLGEQVLRALFFFHPAVWLATARLDAARENLRDLDMLRAGPVSAHAYAVTLLSVLKSQRSDYPAPLLAVAMGRTAARLKDRLLLLKHATGLKSPSRWLIAGATLGVAALILPMAHSAATKAKVTSDKPASISVRAKTNHNVGTNAEVRVISNDEGFAVFDADSPLPPVAADVVAPPAPPAPVTGWMIEDMQEAEQDLAEQERDVAQDVAEAQQAWSEARGELARADAENKTDAADSLKDAARDLARAKRHQAEVLRSTNQARRELHRTMARGPGTLDTMVVIDGKEIRCGVAAQKRAPDAIILNGRKSPCTGSLTLADVEGKTRHGQNSIIVFLGQDGSLRLDQKDGSVHVYQDGDVRVAARGMSDNGFLSEEDRRGIAQDVAAAQREAAQAQREAAQAAREAAQAEPAREAARAGYGYAWQDYADAGSMVVVEGNQVRCGTKIRTGSRHAIIVDGQERSCTGALNDADKRGRENDGNRAVGMLGMNGEIRVDRAHGKITSVHVSSSSGIEPTAPPQPPEPPRAPIKKINLDLPAWPEADPADRCPQSATLPAASVVAGVYAPAAS